MHSKAVACSLEWSAMPQKNRIRSLQRKLTPERCRNQGRSAHGGRPMGETEIRPDTPGISVAGAASMGIVGHGCIHKRDPRQKRQLLATSLKERKQRQRGRVGMPGFLSTLGLLPATSLDLLRLGKHLDLLASRSFVLLTAAIRSFAYTGSLGLPSGSD